MRISDWSSDVCSSDLEDHDQAVSRDQDVPQVISLIQRRVRPIGNMRPGLAELDAGFGQISPHQTRDHAAYNPRYDSEEKVKRATVLIVRRQDRNSTRLNSSHYCASRMPSSV